MYKNIICFFFYLGHSLRRGSYPSVKMESVYFTAQVDWANIYIYKVRKVGDRCRRRPKGSLFYSYHTMVWGGSAILSLDCSTLPLRRTLCWVLSKEVSNSIFWVFGMSRPGIELRSLGPLANSLPITPTGLKQVLMFQVRVNQEVMIMKRYFTLLRSPESNLV